MTWCSRIRCESKSSWYYFSAISEPRVPDSWPWLSVSIQRRSSVLVLEVGQVRGRVLDEIDPRAVARPRVDRRHGGRVVHVVHLRADELLRVQGLRHH